MKTTAYIMRLIAHKLTTLARRVHPHGHTLMTPIEPNSSASFSVVTSSGRPVT